MQVRMWLDKLNKIILDVTPQIFIKQADSIHINSSASSALLSFF